MRRTQPRRFRPAVALATGAALALLAPAAPAVADPVPSGLSQPARGATEIVPLSADLQITRITADPDGNQVERESNRYYRDSQGRTRVEDGSSVTITDPATQTTVVLDTAAGTFRRSTPDRSAVTPSAAEERTFSSGRQLASPPRALGEATVGGVRAEGRAYTVTVPAWAGRPRQVHEVTLWQSAEIQLGVQTRVVRESGAVYHQQYTNIRAGSEPSAALFQVPAGYREADPTAGGSINASCPVFHADPFIITSFGPFLGSGFNFAVTDPELGCIFVADAAFFPQIQLFGVPTTPLGLPSDEWFVFDTGAPVPFFPFTAFGEIVFVAANVDGTTTVDSLVILEIF